MQREYYINDAGRQVDILTVSVWVRYLQALGEPVRFPENGYRADYVNAIGASVQAAHGSALRASAASVHEGLPADAPAGDKEQYIDALIARMRALLGADNYQAVQELGLSAMLADIREDLRSFGVEFDTGLPSVRWRAPVLSNARCSAWHPRATPTRRTARCGCAAAHSATARIGAGARQRPADLLRARPRLSPRQARARIRAADRRLGADHHGYIARMRAGLMAMGEEGECLEVCLMQFVSLYRGGEKIPMGKRDGQFVTLRQLRERGRQRRLPAVLPDAQP